MQISAATFVLNAFRGGYPILEAMAVVLPYVDEMVIVEAGSEDGTAELLQSLTANPKIRIVPYTLRRELGPGCYADAQNFALDQCSHQAIIFFQADEVFHERLIWEVYEGLKRFHVDGIGSINRRVWRLQPTQNFQRCKWWPHLVQRVVEKGTTKFNHDGAWTDIQDKVPTLPSKYFLWDVSNCFRDSVKYRRWWRGQVGYTDGDEISDEDLLQVHWIWASSPFNLPLLCDHLIGMTQYRPAPWLVEAIREDNCGKFIC